MKMVNTNQKKTKTQALPINEIKIETTFCGNHFTLAQTYFDNAKSEAIDILENMIWRMKDIEKKYMKMSHLKHSYERAIKLQGCLVDWLLAHWCFEYWDRLDYFFDTNGNCRHKEIQNIINETSQKYATDYLDFIYRVKAVITGALYLNAPWWLKLIVWAWIEDYQTLRMEIRKDLTRRFMLKVDAMNGIEYFDKK